MIKFFKIVLGIIAGAAMVWGTEKFLDKFFDLRLLTFLWDFIVLCANFFNKPIQLPVWAILLIFCSPIIIVFLIAFVVKLFSKPEVETIEQKLPFLNYKNDVFKDILFMWNWQQDFITQKYEVSDLTAMCPKDKYILDDKWGGKYCAYCDRTYNFYDRNQIIKFILQKVHTNTYTKSPN